MNVFISSVVRDFERYRAVARKAVSLLSHTPVMCEEFGARPYSSQEACMTEVDQADVVVLILGGAFGFKTDTGESVTQQEFRRAKNARTPILAFLQDVPADAEQTAFRREVSDYVEGLFRVVFTDEGELSDGIVQGLSQLAVRRHAISEQEFVQHLSQRPSHGHMGNWNRETRLELAFLPQPGRSGTLQAVHAQHEAFFLKLCQAGICTLKEGYTDFDQGDFTGLDTKEISWRHRDSGMSWIAAALTSPVRSHDPFASHYISPSRVRSVSQAAFELLSEGKGGWFQFGLFDTSYKIYAEPPSNSTGSISMPHRAEQNLVERQLLIPGSANAISRWLDQASFRVGRKLSP